MKDRWWRLGLLAIVLMNLWGLRFIVRSEGPWHGFENHDTRIIAQRLQQPHSPWQWFVGDWPLGNSFYRPVTTLAYEVDARLWGLDLVKYKLLNWLIAALCPFALLWFVWELLRSRGFALGCAVLFAGWQSGVVQALPWDWICGVVALALISMALGVLGLDSLFGGAERGPYKDDKVATSKARFFQRLSSRSRFLGAAAVALFLIPELSPNLASNDLHGNSFTYRAMGWIPGRTATLMTLFALCCMAAYCRFERLRDRTHGTDVTDGTNETKEGIATYPTHPIHPTHPLPWLFLSLACFLLALGCYELAVMLPLCLLACAVWLRIQGLRPAWWIHVVPWAVVGGYAYLHHRYLPPVSEYRIRRARSTKRSIHDLVVWLLPGYESFEDFLSVLSLDGGIILVLVGAFWSSLYGVVVNVVAYVRARRWLLAWFGLVLSVAAYGPLAFERPLTHYYYFALAFRSMFVVTLVAGIARILAATKSAGDAT